MVCWGCQRSRSGATVLDQATMMMMMICILSMPISQRAQAWITQFYLQIHHACLSFVSVHQMAPTLTKVGDIQLQLTPHLIRWGGGAVAQRVERWTCDQLVVGSNPTRGTSCVTTLGKLFIPTYVPLSPSSITWYRPRGGDDLRLGR